MSRYLLGFYILFLCQATSGAPSIEFSYPELPGFFEQHNGQFSGYLVHVLQQVGQMESVHFEFTLAPRRRSESLLQLKPNACTGIALLPGQAPPTQYRAIAHLGQFEINAYRKRDQALAPQQLNQLTASDILSFGTVSSMVLEHQSIRHVALDASLREDLAMLQAGRARILVTADISLVMLPHQAQQQLVVVKKLAAFDLYWVCSNQVSPALASALARDWNQVVTANPARHSR